MKTNIYLVSLLPSCLAIRERRWSIEDVDTLGRIQHCTNPDGEPEAIGGEIIANIGGLVGVERMAV